LDLDELDLNAYAEALSHPTVLRQLRELVVTNRPQNQLNKLSSTAILLASKENLGPSPKQRATSIASQFLGHLTAAVAADTFDHGAPELVSALNSWNKIKGDQDAQTYTRKHFSALIVERSALLDMPYLFAVVGVIASEAENAKRAVQDLDSQSLRESQQTITEYLDISFKGFTLLSKAGLPQKGPLNEDSRKQVIQFSWAKRGIIDAYQAAQGAFNSDIGNEMHRTSALPAQKALEDCWARFSDQMDPFLLAPQ
jgi:hypothetical protein